jgi:hypothetical protein
VTASWTGEMLSHEPIRPASPDSFEENAFLAEWQRLARLDPAANPWVGSSFGMLGVAMSDHWPPTDQDSRVAASFAAWLGSEEGRCFLALGEDIEARAGQDLKKLGVASSGHAIAWASMNARQGDAGQSRPTLAETLLASPGKSYSKPTARSLEVLSKMAAWLETDAGRHYVSNSRTDTFHALAEVREAGSSGLRFRLGRFLKERGDARGLTEMLGRDAPWTPGNTQDEEGGVVA